MPTSEIPQRPFRGNKYLIQSREYQQIQKQLGDLWGQLFTLQHTLLTLLQQNSPNGEALPEIPDEARTAPDLPQEVWDQYEADMEALEAANEPVFIEPTNEVSAI